MGLENCDDVQSLVQYLSCDLKTLVAALQEMKLLRQNGKCRKCRIQRTLRLRRNSCVARCPKCKDKEISVAKGTFFEQVRFAYKSVLTVMFAWAAHISVNDTHRLFNYRKDTVAKIFRYFRDVCSWKLLRDKDNFRLGGPGHLVQIDESVVTKRKYHKGKKVPERWVLGILDSNLQRGVVRYVDKRDAATLLPIIQEYVAVGTEIWTDEWKGYSALSRLGYCHKTVCHKRNFKAADGTCTNEVEGYWSLLKQFCRKTNVLKSKLLPEHIDEFMWRQLYCRRATTGITFRTLLHHIQERYPC